MAKIYDNIKLIFYGKLSKLTNWTKLGIKMQLDSLLWLAIWDRLCMYMFLSVFMSWETGDMRRTLLLCAVGWLGWELGVRGTTRQLSAQSYAELQTYNRRATRFCTSFVTDQVLFGLDYWYVPSHQSLSILSFSTKSCIRFRKVEKSWRKLGKGDSGESGHSGESDGSGESVRFGESVELGESVEVGESGDSRWVFGFGHPK